MTFFTRYISGALGVAMIALGLMLMPVTTPVAVAQENQAADVAAPQARELITEVRNELQERRSEIAELTASTPETGPEVEVAAEDLVHAQKRADLALKGLSTPGIEILIVPEAETQALLDAAAGALAELETKYATWNEAAEAARVGREIREAEEAAAAAAAEEAAAAAAAAKQAAASQPAPAGGNTPVPSGYTVYPAGSGDQELIDACVGPVWTGGLPMFLAEHWHCGGASFPLHPGAVVTVAGVGTFQSVGVIIQLDGPNSTYDAIPGGYDLYYQTCLNNNPATTGVVGLQRIG